MGRWLLLLLGIAFAVAINPVLRERAEPYLQPALDPLYEWSARSRLGDISGALQAERALNHALPDARGFGGFLRAHFRGEQGALDPWGVPYYLREHRGRVTVGSAGRDRRPFTGDDLAVRLPAS